MNGPFFSRGNHARCNDDVRPSTSAANAKGLYFDKLDSSYRRAEMWMKSKEWLEDPAGAAIPDSDTLQADACGPAYKYDSNTRLQLESKADMRKRDIASPDEWDAVALTFAEPVAPASFRRRLEYPNLGIV